MTLYGSVRAPDQAAATPALAQASFDAWPEGRVRGYTGLLPVRRPIAKGADLPVSPRLIASWPHGDRQNGISQLLFDPEKKWLYGASYPGGIVQKWDVATGKQAWQLDTGAGYRGSAQFVNLSGDGKTLYVTYAKQSVKAVEKNGQRLNQFTFDSGIRAWDAATAKPLETLRQEPPGYIAHLQMLPGGTQALATTEPPGEFQGRPPREVWLVDLKAKRWTQLPKEFTGLGSFSPDGKLFSAPIVDGENHTRKLGFYSVPGFKLLKELAVEGKAPSGGYGAFSADGRHFAALIQHFPKAGDFSSFAAEMQLIDVEAAKVAARWPAPEPKTGYFGATFSPDGRTLAFVDWAPPAVKRDATAARLHLVDAASRTLRSVDLADADRGEGLPRLGPPVFSPDGQRVAVMLSRMTDEHWRLRDQMRADDWPQARVLAVDVPSGTLLEAMVCPRGLGGALLFSPDGQRLFAGGTGKALAFGLAGLPSPAGR